MKPSNIRTAFAIAAMALLSACGDNSTDMANESMNASLISRGENAPVADCEAEGCNRPRIIDGLAEQYRSGAIEQQAQAAEPTEPAGTGDPAQPAQAAAQEASPQPIQPDSTEAAAGAAG
jgi:hypothetical protein